MCGIAAIVTKQGHPEMTSTIKSMTEALVRRGPNAEGFFINELVALGHRRLAIIDLETGNQPIYNEDKSVVTVLNGEIYNFKSLREELVRQGHVFNTKSDAEVIVHGYEHWGIDSLLERLDGMFAFALYDNDKAHTYIVRDRFGEKPLYYYVSDGDLYCASELKALQTSGFSKKISKKGLNLFLSLSYIPAPYTIYENVYKLEAGHYLHCAAQGIQHVNYYRLEDHIKASALTFEEAKFQLRNLIEDSVRTHMVADVPIGAFLSGGIDSSIIVALMSQISSDPISTFSIGFKEKDYDESDRALLIANTFQTKHMRHYLDYDDVFHLIDDIVSYFDEPYADSSAIPSYYVAKLARNKVPVVLTGDCADELFGGYEKYLGEYYAKRYNRMPWLLRKGFEVVLRLIPYTPRTNSFLRKANKVVRNASLSDFDASYQYMCIGFTDDERKKLLKEDCFTNVKPLVKNVYDQFDSEDKLNRVLFSDIHTVLEGDMFPKVDRTCMMNSLESRAPFMTRGIVEFAMSLPSSYKVKGKKQKHILKEAFRDLLPAKTFEFSKSGFRVPVGAWFKHELKDELLSLVSPQLVSQQALFDVDVVSLLIKEHLSGKVDHSSKLWVIFVFQRWYLKNK